MNGKFLQTEAMLVTIGKKYPNPDDCKKFLAMRLGVIYGSSGNQ
jgi:hypothetical protein